MYVSIQQKMVKVMFLFNKKMVKVMSISVGIHQSSESRNTNINAHLASLLTFNHF